MTTLEFKQKVLDVYAKLSSHYGSHDIAIDALEEFRDYLLEISSDGEG